MNIRTVKSDFLLLLTAAIWGFAFVAQRMGMEFVGPFLFNAIRFALGTAAMLPFVLRTRRKPKRAGVMPGLVGCLAAGIFLFLGSSLQQVGIVYTTAGKAGFITGLYVIIVPFIGVFFKHKIGFGNWTGAILAAVGLYFLTITNAFIIQKGDFLVFLSAFFWAAHVHIIAWLAPQIESSRIAMLQFAIVSILSFFVAFAIESFALCDIFNAAIPILYGGLMSVGVAYTLQVVAQKYAPPTHAAIILSLEAVFAVLGGWLVLSEMLSRRSVLGCAFMLTGMLISHVGSGFRPSRRIKASIYEHSPQKDKLI
ncbi:DMT family transporter [candidate division KSB1 bacterium]|nr:DMT family transporter [candidate division KSB1 bacterium]RQW03106.1 MAG: DMT family transporter [candidate division KSB1 bacterium]